LGSPATDDYIDHCLLRGRARIDFRGLSPQLKLELQYAVQCRHDERTITAAPPVVTWAIRQAKQAAVGPLLDYGEAQWRHAMGPRRSSFEAFLLYARDAVA
jgi:hypothetical protein